jgi:Na+(H+)/acetate symporter ActP
VNATYATVAIALITGVTLTVGGLGLRFSRTTSDFYVASRAVSPLWNASAISGEYLSAASFLGVAGLIFAYGLDMLWYPVGYAAGYLVLLLFVAAPLRRSGAYTLPDFAEARLGSYPVRRMASVLVVVIGWLYLVPQLQAAGLTLQTTTGAPRWLGGLLVAAVVLISVLSGGMRSITAVQAFQYWVKLTAISIPLLFCVIVWSHHGSPAITGHHQAVFDKTTTVKMDSTSTVSVNDPVTVDANGTIDGINRIGPFTLHPGKHRVADGTRLKFPAGATVPVLSNAATGNNSLWAGPFASAVGHHPLYATYSLVLATFLGTMGLPHVLVRFYTNPDGHAARRTALVVLALLGAFYLLPTAYGALGRLYTPELLLTGKTDAVVLSLPGRLLPGIGGELLGALTAAGAFAAFLSTSSGLTVSVAGVLAQDVLPAGHTVRREPATGAISRVRREPATGAISRVRREPATGAISGVRGFRVGTVLAVIAPYLFSVIAADLSIADAVGLAFAVAASSFCPLLLLGIWWRGLTDVGAAAGLIIGGGLATAAVLTTMATHPHSGWIGALLAEPAAMTVPIAFAVMIAGSVATRARITPRINAVMVMMHAPESLQLPRPDR